MRIATVVGARPQFIKAAVVSRALAGNHEEFLIHTGQHYDDNMSDVFFRELGIPAPRFTLQLGGGAHGEQTGAMLREIERILVDTKPDALLVYGDTNSTLAGALAASKLHIPVAHVEAGLRSFNRRMPEEINRVLTDHLARWLFAPGELSAANLKSEGITSGVSIVGDVMLDVARESLERSTASPLVADLRLNPGKYVVATLHRADTTDSEGRLRRALEELGKLDSTVVLPVHPRTAARLSAFSLSLPRNVIRIPPTNHAEMLRLVSEAMVTITDSGGLQKEAYFAGCPCVTYRTETEWVETLQTGWNVLCNPDSGSLAEAVSRACTARDRPRPNLYGDGNAASRIAASLS